MYDFAKKAPIDLLALRERLCRMSSEELREFGKAGEYMCSPHANFGKAPREEFLIQLREAKEEWKRRATPSRA